MAKTKRKRPPTPPPTPVDPATVELDDNERRFVEEYLVDRRATGAYLRCNPNVTRRSAAAALGHEMKNRPHVAAEIRAGLALQRARCAVRADKVLEELAMIADSDVLDLYDEQTNQLRHPRNIPYQVRKCVASIKVSRQRTTTRTRNRTSVTVTDSIVEYKLWDKIAALGKLMRHLGLETEITPLDALLAALPADLREQVRRALIPHAGRTITASPNGNGKH